MSCLTWPLRAQAYVSSHCSQSHHTQDSNQVDNQFLPTHPFPSVDEEQGKAPCFSFSQQCGYQVPQQALQTLMHEKQPER